METLKMIQGSTTNEIWQQVTNDLAGKDILEYDVVLQQEGLPAILLEIEIDLGGGFEGGYEWTRFSAPVSVQDDFRFALHHESFLDKAGKLLGLEDKVIGYEDFDAAVIVKTNDEQKVKAIFADAATRNFFQTLEDFNLHIVHHENASTKLELEIERGITDPTELRTAYEAFSKVLVQL
jgi:hypothetical protein